MLFATCSTGNTKTHKVYTAQRNGVCIYFQLNPHHSSETNEKPNQLFPFAVCPDTTKRLFNEIQGARSVKRRTVPLCVRLLSSTTVVGDRCWKQYR